MNRMPVLLLLSIVVSGYGLDSLSLQKCMIMHSTGSIQIWIKEKNQWVRPEEIKECKQGHTVQTQDKSQLVLTLEPAMTATIEENTVVGFDKLLIDRGKKNIRMVLRQDKGVFRIKMEPLFGNTALLTLATPSAIVDLNGAEATIMVLHDTTIVDLLSGAAKARFLTSNAKTVLFANTRAIICPQNSEILISSLGDQPQTSVQLNTKKVAILSIQSSTVDKDNLERVSDFIAEEVEKKSTTKVLFLDDIKAMLQAEGYSSLLTCYTDSCLSKIGDILGVDAVIVGGLGQLGNNYLFSLKMIDVLRNNVLNRENVKVTGDIGQILDEIPDMVGKIVQNTSTNTVVQVSSSNKKIENVESMKYQETISWIKGGSFSMGARTVAAEPDESPLHVVEISGFYMDKYEVSRVDFEKVMGFNPSSSKGCGECPVDNVSWAEAMEYCKKVGKRLPTEAEWEYACRAGSTTPFSFGTTLSSDLANFNGKFPYAGAPIGQFRERAVPVGSYKPNAWNLYDMHGNVAEWCLDWYDQSYYGNSVKVDPLGPDQGKLKVVRGGNWGQKASSLRSAKRAGYNPDMRLNTIGFRCVKPDVGNVK